MILGNISQLEFVGWLGYIVGVKTKYITTSIAYINAEPHIGYLYELLAGDVLKRYYQLQGEEVFFLTGTDEHGLKIAQAAEAAGQKPAEFADKISGKFKTLCKEFNIDWDYFIRTTNPDHIKFVQEKWQQLESSGVLKKEAYSGRYCTGCEAFKTDAEIVDGKCIIHETAVEKVEEENWFLQIKDLKSQIKPWIETSVFPASRRQEAINVLDSGAYDQVSVSRPKHKNSWGIEVPGDPEQVMYVWVDALFNYISALKINSQEELWPADVQIIGKDILKFHAIIWPALLLATGYELPKKLLVHGFINVDGKKMSKSIGNVVAPKQLLDSYDVDGTRYLLFRGLSWDEDSNFTWADFDRLYNGELANGLGNLVARLIGILKKAHHELKLEVEIGLDDPFDFAQALRRANDDINAADQIITREKLWENPADKQSAIQEAVSFLVSAVAVLEPFMPETAVEIRRQLTGLDSKPLFPRL